MPRHVGGRDAEVRANLLEPGSIKSAFKASGSHSLDAAAPLFDERQLLKYPAEHTIAQFRDSSLDILNLRPKGSNPGFSTSSRSSNNATRMGAPV